MHKDGQMTKAIKEQLRAKHMKERDLYEAKNCGSFRRCYPNPDPVSF
jgi:hypothetical protein